MRLSDRVALITGAASGIGRAASLLFAENGAAVIAVDVDATGGEEPVALIPQHGGHAS